MILTEPTIPYQSKYCRNPFNSLQFLQERLVTLDDKHIIIGLQSNQDIGRNPQRRLTKQSKLGVYGPFTIDDVVKHSVLQIVTTGSPCSLTTNSTLYWAFTRMEEKQEVVLLAGVKQEKADLRVLTG